MFKKDEYCNWSQHLGATARITEIEKEDLEKMFDEKELKEAIWSCGSNKSPGPDGFTMEFFKKFWDLIKSDLLEAFNEFQSHGKIPMGMNAAFITLISKVQNPLTVKDYRPISLISSVYKILSKMLANRLKKFYLKLLIRHSLHSLKTDRFWMVL